MLTSDDLYDLRIKFYEWCRLLSLDELVSNEKLLECIAVLEQQLINSEYLLRKGEV